MSFCPRLSTRSSGSFTALSVSLLLKAQLVKLPGSPISPLVNQWWICSFCPFFLPPILGVWPSLITQPYTLLTIHAVESCPGCLQLRIQWSSQPWPSREAEWGCRLKGIGHSHTPQDKFHWSMNWVLTTDQWTTLGLQQLPFYEQDWASWGGGGKRKR